MKKAFTLSLLAGAALVAMPMAQATADGHSMKKVVHDVRGNVVKNTFDNCVITKWDSTHNECGVDTELLTVYFPFASSKLTPAAKAKLDTLVDMLSGSSVESVDIVGFADVIGDRDSNRRLSRRRGNSVTQYLSGYGSGYS